MKTKLFTFFLALVASVGTMFAWDYEHVQIGDLYYNLDATNQTAEVARRSSASGEIIIPTSVTYDEITYSVTSIEEYAFAECRSLTSVSIGNSVTSIGEKAFSSCGGLTSVTIPNSVTSIGERAFSGCSSLTSPLYNAHVFAYMPTSYSGAYSIPSGIESIAGGAFSSCSGLTSVTIPNSVTSIGSDAFEYCSGFPVIDNIRYADTYLIEAVDKTLSTYTIKDGTKWIGSYAFYNCTGLTSVTIPNSVTSIGEKAFFKCSGLTSVTIPNSVTSIGDWAFCNCSGLTSVTIPNSVTSIGNFAFNICTGLTSPIYNAHVFAYMPRSYSGAYSIPSGIESIAGGAFAFCSGLTSVTIGNSVTSIGDRAFDECSSLTSVTIGNSVTSIGDDAFSDCSGLTSVTIPNSVTSIGEGAFYRCSGLKNVILGSSVKVLEAKAFDYCSSIETITCYSQRPPTVNHWAFENLDYSTIVYVPADYLETYKMHDAWGLFDVRPLGAKSTETTDVNVTPAENTAEVAWPAVSGAATYELVIKDKSGNVICTLIFNANGQLTQIAFNAPARNNAPQQTQAAGFSFTVTGLENGTSYDLTITSKDNNGGTLDTKTVSFTTTGDEQGIEDVLSDQVQSTKVIRNGQIYILRGEKVYTVTGQEVR